jgi:hypothetical protein
VEYGLSLPPLVVVFQFNPVQLSRKRSLRFDAPAGFQADGGDGTLRDFHLRQRDLKKVRDVQKVTVAEEAISFDVRLDATDGMDEGKDVEQLFGISPRLAALELMVQPKDESVTGQVLDIALGPRKGFSFSKVSKPPLVLFVWGRKRVMPVNINALEIVETDYSPDLNPIRATASVQLTVIEGRNAPQLYTGAMKDAMAALNLAHIGEIKSVVVPG